jgi:hypothetical protein
LVSSDPKLGTSADGMAAYLYKFDEQSPTSMFGNVSTYTDNDSWYSAFFGKTYFDQDRQLL